MLAVQIAAYSSRLADKEEIMQNSNTDGEHVWNGGQINWPARIAGNVPKLNSSGTTKRPFGPPKFRGTIRAKRYA